MKRFQSNYGSTISFFSNLKLLKMAEGIKSLSLSCHNNELVSILSKIVLFIKLIFKIFNPDITFLIFSNLVNSVKLIKYLAKLIVQIILGIPSLIFLKLRKT